MFAVSEIAQVINRPVVTRHQGARAGEMLKYSMHTKTQRLKTNLRLLIYYNCSQNMIQASFDPNGACVMYYRLWSGMI